MTTPSLVPLVCPKCQTALPAQPDEVAWVCSNCGQAALLDGDQPQGLAALEIHYAAAVPEGAKGNPYWMAQGQVTLSREAYFSLTGNDSRQAAKFWGQPHDFFVPAFDCSLEQMIDLGVNLLRQPPNLKEGAPVAFAPVTLPVSDAHAMAEFIVVGIEAERRDKVKEVNFTLDLQPPALWILP